MMIKNVHVKPLWFNIQTDRVSEVSQSNIIVVETKCLILVAVLYSEIKGSTVWSKFSSLAVRLE